MQKLIKLIILYLGILAILAGLAYFFSRKKQDSDLGQHSASHSSMALILAAEQIERYWQNGQWPENVYKCDQLTELISYLKTHELKIERFLQCEPQALECFLKMMSKEPLSILTSDRQDWQIQAVAVHEDEILVTRYHEDLEVSSASKLFFFQLFEPKARLSHLFSIEDSCLDHRLREGLHPYSEPKPVGEDFIWDNRHRAIYIDRFLVSQGQFYDWIQNAKFNHPFKINSQNSGLERFKIAADIPLEWQRRYCEAQGKTLAQSHILDGASFFPAQLQSDQIMIYPRGPYPQGRRKLDAYLGEIMDKPDLEIDLPKLCKEAFTAECLKHYQALLSRFPSGLSFQGIEHVLGGMPEASINKIEPEQRVRLSSFYFNARDPIHRLGKRFAWDGERFESAFFDLDQELPSILGIGFRCMKVGR